ncbi:MAG: hemerythrin domain-containing protein [Candidatus Nanoarchaeia archaeon]|nr:hemerythrin domain-containing protein [Candidatus Nanoarchaeia archaeon]
MADELSIADMMIRHHYNVENIITEFNEKQKNDGKSVFEVFQRMKWELEKHFFLEENAIFIFYDPKSKEDSRIVNHILVEHETMLKKLNEIEKKLKNNETVDISKFTKRLIQHKELEDNVFYPMLDNQLDEKQKLQITEKIKKLS